MTRIGRLTVFLLPVLLTMTGCGNGGSSDNEDTRAASADPAKTTVETDQVSEPDTPGRSMIPPPGPDAVEGLLIAPYFDADGTTTEMAVEPGKLFSVYICVEHPGYSMATAQWRMTVPDGVKVLGEKKVYPQALSIGAWDSMFLITYPCETSDERMELLEYTCVAGEDFQGGEFETVKAKSFNDEHAPAVPFLGFVTCGAHPEQVPAYGGTAVLKRK
jgi:hypothetical protein